MITKMCRTCGKLIPYPMTYCEEHTPTKQDKAANDKYYNKHRRNVRNDKFYHSKEWKALSAYVLQQADYKCSECGKLAVEVHHLIEVNDDWDKRLDVNNCQPLCTSCHNKKRI